MKKQIISSVMAFAMLASMTPVYAAEIQTAGGTGETPVVVTVEAATFSVTVPTSLPVNVDASGVVSYPDEGVKIINNSAGAVKVEDVDVEANDEDGWSIVAFDKDKADFLVDAKEIGLQLNSADEKTQEDGSFAFDSSKWTVMEATDGADGGADEFEFSYAANLAPQSQALTDTEVANVIFTIGWDD